MNMPTYDYECSKCKHKFEVFQKITEDALTKCPECGHRLKRLIGSGSGVIFKGAGFYATDYRKKAPPICPKNKDGCGGCQS